MRFIEFLIEDAKADLEKRKFALNAFNLVKDYLSKHSQDDNWGFNYRTTKDGNIVYIKKFGDITQSMGNNEYDDYSNLWIRLVASEEGKLGGIGTITSGPRAGQNVLVLYVLLPGDPSKHVYTRFGNIKSTFVHEFTHLMDKLRVKNKEVFTSGGTAKKAENILGPSGDPRIYYSDPIEYNAFYQETLDKIDNYLDEFVQKIPKESAKFLIKRVIGDGKFPTFMRNVKKMFFPEDFVLYPKYEQKLAKRLYNYYQYIIPRLKEKRLI